MNVEPLTYLEPVMFLEPPIQPFWSAYHAPGMTAMLAISHDKPGAWK
jgi:hypothetical protein